MVAGPKSRTELLYEAMSKSYGDKLPDYDTFEKGMANPETRVKVYNLAKRRYKDSLPAFDVFDKSLADEVRQKGGQTTSAYDQPEATTEITPTEQPGMGEQELADFLQPVAAEQPKQTVADPMSVDSLGMAQAKSSTTGVAPNPQQPQQEESLDNLEYDTPGTLKFAFDAINRGILQGEQSNILNVGDEKLSDTQIEGLANISKRLQDGSLPRSPAYEKFINSKGLGESLKALTESPQATGNIIAELTLESLAALITHGSLRAGTGAVTGGTMGSIVPGIGTTAGAALGAVSGLGLSSLNLEYTGSILGSLQEAGVDITDAESLKKGFENDKVMSDAKKLALQRGVPIAVWDMMSAGVAGRITSQPAKTILRKAGQISAEMGVQAGMGMAGEAQAQATVGDPVNWSAILAEGIGEIGGGAPEVVAGTMARQQTTTNNGKEQNVQAAKPDSGGAGDVTQQPTDAGKQAAGTTSESVDKNEGRIRNQSDRADSQSNARADVNGKDVKEVDSNTRRRNPLSTKEVVTEKPSGQQPTTEEPVAPQKAVDEAAGAEVVAEQQVKDTSALKDVDQIEGGRVTKYSEENPGLYKKSAASSQFEWVSDDGKISIDVDATQDVAFLSELKKDSLSKEYHEDEIPPRYKNKFDAIVSAIKNRADYKEEVAKNAKPKTPASEPVQEASVPEAVAEEPAGEQASGEVDTTARGEVAGGVEVKPSWMQTGKEVLQGIRKEGRKSGGDQKNLYSTGKGMLESGMTIQGIPASEIPGWEDAITSHKQDVEKAVSSGMYQKAISEGRMTSEEAKVIIEGAGVEVPSDLIKTDVAESKPTEQYKPSAAPKAISFEFAGTIKTGTITETITNKDGSVKEYQVTSPTGTKHTVRPSSVTNLDGKVVSMESTPDGNQYGVRDQNGKLYEVNNVFPGIFNHGTSVGFVADIIPNITKFLQKYLTSRGNLPQNVFEKAVRMNSVINADLNQLKYLGKDLRYAVEKYGMKDQIKNVDNALKGRVPLNDFPIPVAEAVAAMRAHVDQMSKRMIDEGVVQGDMVDTISENMGQYLTRSYRVHDSPKEWGQYLKSNPEGQQIINRAIGFIRGQYPNATAEEVRGIVETLLYNPEAPMAIIKGAKLGAKDLGILMKRKDIAPEIRALMGEYTDPLVNYSRSVTKMAHLIAKDKFLKEVKQEGLGTFLLEKPTSSHYAKIAAEESRVMAPLNGLYTTPEIAEAFQDFQKNESPGRFLEMYYKVNGFVKYSKTVLSLMTHMRNIVGNLGFIVANGHWRAGKMSDSVRITFNDLTNRNSKDFREQMNRYISLGVVYDNPQAGELQDAIKDANSTILDPSMTFDKSIARVKTKIAKGITSAYQAEDNMFKIFAFENEVARYSNALHGKSFDQLSADQKSEIEIKAAQIVRNTYPTYSMTPEAVKQMRRFPLTGTFVSFPAEVIRTFGNTIALAKSEISNPETKGIGAQRIAGLLTMIVVPTTASILSQNLWGYDEDDDKEIDEFVAPWEKNGTRIYTDRNKKGVVEYIDLSFSEPHNYLKKPVYAMLRGEDPFDAGVDAVSQLLAPFLGEEILTSKLLDVSRNKKKDSGRPVYNPEDPVGDKLKDVYNHLAEALEPGTVRSFRRIWTGIHGEENEYGKKYDPEIEILATLSGQRIQKLDVGQSFQFKLYRTWVRMNDATSDYNILINKKGNKDEEKLNDEYENANSRNKEILDELKKAYSYAIGVGVPKKQIDNMLRQSKIPGQHILYIQDIRDYTPLIKRHKFSRKSSN